jgi:hypothetical protein
MSSLVHTTAYINLPTTDWYGTLLISSFSVLLLGHCFELSLWWPASGEVTDLASFNLNLSSTFSMYLSYKSQSSFFDLSKEIFMPSIFLAGPKSFMANDLLNAFLRWAILCWDSKQKTKKFLYTHNPWSIYVVEHNGTATIFIPLKTECAWTFPHKRCRWRQPKPTSRSCSHTSRRRPAPHERRLRGITHVRCIDVVWAPVQQSSGRRWIYTRNPAARWRPTWGVSFNSLTKLQTWEPSQEEDRKREGMNEPRGPGGLYIGVGGRWNLPQAALPTGGTIPGRRRP